MCIDFFAPSSWPQEGVRLAFSRRQKSLKVVCSERSAIFVVVVRKCKLESVFIIERSRSYIYFYLFVQSAVQIGRRTFAENNVEQSARNFNGERERVGNNLNLLKRSAVRLRLSRTASERGREQYTLLFVESIPPSSPANEVKNIPTTRVPTRHAHKTFHNFLVR